MKTENSATRVRTDLARLELAIEQQVDNPSLRAKLCDLLSILEGRLKRFEEFARNHWPFAEAVDWSRLKSQQITDASKQYGATTTFAYEPTSPADDPTATRLLAHLQQLRAAVDAALDADRVETWTLSNHFDAINRIEKQLDRRLLETGAVLDLAACDALHDGFLSAVVEWAKYNLPDSEVWATFVGDILAQPLVGDRD